MAYTNIMELFARISLADLCAYLSSRDWEVDEDSDETVRFRGPAGVSGDMGEIWTWRPDSHPKFRRRVPDVLFSLSIHEGRPALEIANELIGMGRREAKTLAAETARRSDASPLDSTIAAEMATTFPASLVYRPWTLTHRGADALIVQLLPTGGTHSLEPGESLVIVREGQTTAGVLNSVNLEWAESAIRIHLPSDDLTTRVAQSAAYVDATTRPPVSRVVAEELRGLPHENGDEPTPSYLEGLAETMRRVEFELDSVGPIDARSQQAYRRQTAMVAATLARLLPAMPWARRALWRVAMRMVALADLALELHTTSTDELYVTAVSDNPTSPTRTLEWLVARTVPTYRT